MRRRIGLVLAVLIAMGGASAAGAATLDFTGTLSFEAVFPLAGSRGPVSVQGSGQASLATEGGGHLASLIVPQAAFGPGATSFDFGYDDVGSFTRLLLTLTENESGQFTTSSGGAMGLSGLLRLCLVFDPSCTYVSVPLPLSPTLGGAGFGVGGTQIASGANSYTYQHAPWTLGDPSLTLHTAGSNVTTPVLPGGFAHGPASLTSTTAQPSGALQLVTVTKVYTTLSPSELAATAVLNLHFVPEPGTFLLLLASAIPLAVLGSRRR